MNRLFRRVAAIAVAFTATCYAFASFDSLPTKQINGKTYHFYTVKSKETVYSLCKRFDISAATILEFNPDVAGGLKEGMELVFPADKTGASTSQVVDYEVKRGETGYGIAHHFGMSLDEFYTLNPTAHDGLKVGQVVKVYSAVTSTAGSNTPAVDKNIVTTPIAHSSAVSSPSDGADKCIATTAPGTSVYTIQPGETLYQIAKRNGLTIRDITNNNKDLDVDHYEAGQTIILPVAGAHNASPDEAAAPAQSRYYTAKEGDTLFGIAHAHGLSVDQLRAANPTVGLLEVGQVLVLPDQCAETGTAADQLSPMPAVGASEAFNIALVLPLNAGSAKRDAKNASMTEFYRGFVLAIDSMRNVGRPVNLMVFDSKGTQAGVNSVFSDPKLKTANMIIGPQTAEQMTQFAKFASDNNAYLLNLFVVRDQSYLTKPNVLHNNIPHQALYAKAIDYFISRYPDVVPVFLARTEGKSDKGEFVAEFKKALKAAGRKYHEINYKQLSEATLNQLPAGKDYAFIPNSSKKEELDTFISAVLNYKEGRTDGSVALWGYSEWLTFRGDNMKKLHDANTLLFSRFYSVVNDSSEEQLESAYKRWYGTVMADKVPCQGTFGFDTGMYILHALANNNGDFSKSVEPYDGLQNAFDFISVDGGGKVNNEMYIINLAPGDFTLKYNI